MVTEIWINEYLKPQQARLITSEDITRLSGALMFYRVCTLHCTPPLLWDRGHLIKYIFKYTICLQLPLQQGALSTAIIHIRSLAQKHLSSSLYQNLLSVMFSSKLIAWEILVLAFLTQIDRQSPLTFNKLLGCALLPSKHTRGIHNLGHSGKG